MYRTAVWADGKSTIVTCRVSQSRTEVTWVTMPALNWGNGDLIRSVWYWSCESMIHEWQPTLTPRSERLFEREPVTRGYIGEIERREKKKSKKKADSKQTQREWEMVRSREDEEVEMQQVHRQVHCLRGRDRGEKATEKRASRRRCLAWKGIVQDQQTSSFRPQRSLFSARIEFQGLIVKESGIK